MLPSLLLGTLCVQVWNRATLGWQDFRAPQDSFGGPPPWWVSGLTPLISVSSNCPPQVATASGREAHTLQAAVQGARRRPTSASQVMCVKQFLAISVETHYLHNGSKATCSQAVDNGAGGKEGDCAQGHPTHVRPALYISASKTKAGRHLCGGLHARHRLHAASQGNKGPSLAVGGGGGTIIHPGNRVCGFETNKDHAPKQCLLFAPSCFLLSLILSLACCFNDINESRPGFCFVYTK